MAAKSVKACKETKSVPAARKMKPPHGMGPRQHAKMLKNLNLHP